MTNAQKWVGIFLAVFILLFVLTRFFKEDSIDNEQVSFYGDEIAEQESPEGLTLLNNIGCTACHGDNVQGTKLAPALNTANEYWDRDDLINYLRNPASYQDSDRLADYKKLYPNIIMPAYNNIDVKDLGKIADYLLSLEK